MYFAYLILIVNAVLQTLQTPYLYYLEKGNAGLVPIDEVFLGHGNQYVRYEFNIIALFSTVLWGVKASFLALSWQLFTGLAVYKRWLMGVGVVRIWGVCRLCKSPRLISISVSQFECMTSLRSKYFVVFVL